MFGNFGVDLFDGCFAFFALSHIAKLIFNAHVDIATKLNVGAAAGHVGGNGYCTWNTGLRNDLGFLFMITRIQNIVRNSKLLEMLGQVFGFVD